MKTWTDEQKEIIRSVATESTILVSACAGSGKTELMRGCYEYMTSPAPKGLGMDPARIIGLPFTRIAAKTQKERLEKRNPLAKSSKIKTMHSFGFELLRTAPEFKGRKLCVADDKALIKAAGLAAFPGIDPGALLGAIQGFRDQGLDINDIKAVKTFCNQRDRTRGRLSQFVGGYRQYMEVLEKMHSGQFGEDRNTVYIDKPDMIIMTTELMRSSEPFSRSLRNSFDALLMDEFQDINKPQLDFIKLLRELNPKMKLIAVGDDDQKIYMFRGAIANIIQRQAEEWGVKPKVLSINFRSTWEIVDAMSPLVGSDPNRGGTKLKAAPDRHGRKPSLLVAESFESEKKMIVDLVRDALSRGYAPEEITVMTRPNRLAREFAAAMKNAGIPVSLSNENIVESKFLEIASATDGSFDQIMKSVAEAADSGYFEETEYKELIDIVEGLKGLSAEEINEQLTEMSIARNDSEKKAEKGFVTISTIHGMKGAQRKVVIGDVTKGEFPRNGAMPTKEEINNLYVLGTRAEEELYFVADGSRGVSTLVTENLDPDHIDGLGPYIASSRQTVFTRETEGVSAKEEDYDLDMTFDTDLETGLEISERESAESPEKTDAVDIGDADPLLSDFYDWSEDGVPPLTDKYSIDYYSIVNAYVASMTDDVDTRLMISRMSPVEAFGYGDRLKLSPEEDTRFRNMSGKLLARLEKAKYAIPVFREALERTVGLQLSSGDDRLGSLGVLVSIRTGMMPDMHGSPENIKAPEEKGFQPSVPQPQEKRRAPDTSRQDLG